MMPDRRLIEEWLPVAEIGIESGRERTPLTPYPAPNRLHTWWARRPLVLSRAAVLASILPASIDRRKFIRTLGIHGDPVKTRHLINQANKEKKKLGNPYGYKRAFTYVPDNDDYAWLHGVVGRDLGTIFVLDPTAGGGSIPMESHRIGCVTAANDINPVAALLLRATVNWPSKFGTKLLDEFQDLRARFIARMKSKYEKMLQAVPMNTALWARTVPCPHCSGLIPLSPNWRIAPDGTGVWLEPNTANGSGSKGRVCSFHIVRSVQKQSDGTVRGGDGLCPYPDCGRAISGDEIKAAAKSGNMGEQMYAIEFKKPITTRTKIGKLRKKWVKDYREPKPEDYDAEFIRIKLAEKLQEWDVHDVIPTEQIPYGSKTKDATRFGVDYWRDMFSPRQLLCHGTGVETFRELLNEDRQNGSLTDIRKAAYGYLAIALDSLVNYNSRLTTWHANRVSIGPTFARHDYGFSWSYAEMAPLVAGLGYEWAFGKTVDSLQELIALVGSTQNAELDQRVTTARSEPIITCKSGDSLDHMENDTVDVIVMDPPYYDNVMYAELSDFFYVWLKRTAGMVFPELFRRNLTDKENEAVANPAKFPRQKGAKAMAGQDYEERMGLIFGECRRVLKPSGIMTVMFMHKSTGAWNALAKSIIDADFYIATSWPINSEARGSLHIRDKAAAKSTILLACRPRQPADTTSYWEDVEPRVRESVRNRMREFEKAGMRGVDIYLSAFGPALEEYSRGWPMKRSTPRRDNIQEDPYLVTPEDALNAARREVKQWRLAKLVRSTPNKSLDSATAFFVLAWDAFESPRFPYDEALHLARAVDVDIDRDVVGRFAKKEGDYLALWDSQKHNLDGARTARRKSRAMIDALHHAAYLGRKGGAETAIKYIESEQLDKDDSFMAALEAMLEVLPPSHTHTGISLKGDLASASGDFAALLDIRRLKFNDRMGDPNQLKLYE